MIDETKCMASADGSLGGPRCGAEPTHDTWVGPRCTKHAEHLRTALRSPSSVANMMLKRARTEDEIAKLVRPRAAA